MEISRENFKVPPLSIPIVAFLISILLSLKNALHKTLALQDFLWIFFLLVLYCVSTGLKEEDRKKILKAVGLASMLAGVYGMLQYFGIDFIPWEIHWDRRPSSSFGNPNFAAGWWAAVVPLFLAQWADSKTKNRWFWLMALVLGACNLYWVKTRGAWAAEALAFLAAAAFLFSQRFKNRFVRRGLLSAPVFTLCAGFFLIWFKPFDISRIQDPSVRERVFKWETAKAMIRDHPVFGVGAGNLKTNFALYQAAVKEKMQIPLKGTSETFVHNETLQIWAEQGAVGLVSFTLIWMIWAWKFIQAWKDADFKKNLLPLGIFTGVWAVLFYALTNFPFHVVPVSCLTFFLLGISEPNCAAAVKKQMDSPNEQKKWRTAGFLILGIVLGIYIWIPPVRADYFRQKAKTENEKGNLKEAASFYEKAIELDRAHSERTAYELGECYRRLGEIQKAIGAYQISTRLRNYGEVYNNMGNCYYLLRNWDEAAKNWKTALRLGLPDPEIQNQTENNLKILKQARVEEALK